MLNAKLKGHFPLYISNRIFLYLRVSECREVIFTARPELSGEWNIGPKPFHIMLHFSESYSKK